MFVTDRTERIDLAIQSPKSMSINWLKEKQIYRYSMTFLQILNEKRGFLQMRPQAGVEGEKEEQVPPSAGASGSFELYQMLYPSGVFQNWGYPSSWMV